ncbi:DEAD/DEAH box helicase [Sutterella sp.]|uniref:DEAD/DEAH box helicase n=1 Tax=Sutterella sp. TaxID=1981025 RepID=UPI0026DFD437|nr:DEAD/DEAH box helicase [Sutterella sp.]MDO5531990.1 DEAD/DEAH box helicase [Sutterella sp.]
MASLSTIGYSWESREWIETFTERFPQYTSPGIWIAAQERLHSLKHSGLVWDRTTRTVRLTLKNSRGQPYSLALHFYPGATPSLTGIMEAAEKFPGLIDCMRDGDYPPALADAIRESGENVFMRNPGEIEFDPGMMSSECALLLTAFLDEVEQEPAKWFRFIGLDFADAVRRRDRAEAEEAHERSLDALAREDAARAAEAPEAEKPQDINFRLAPIEQVCCDLAARIPVMKAGEMDAEGAVQRLKVWRPTSPATMGSSLAETLPVSGLSPLHARGSWCAFGDAEAYDVTLTILRAAMHSAYEAISALDRREQRQDRTPAVTANTKWVKFLETEAEVYGKMDPSRLRLAAGVYGTRRLAFALVKMIEGERMPRTLHVTPEGFLHSILAVTRRELLPMHPEFAVWHTLTLAAAEILAAGAVIPVPALLPPEATEQREAGLRCYWMPAVHSPGVSPLLSEVFALTDGMLPLERSSLFQGFNVSGSGDGVTASQKSRAAALWAITLIITEFVRSTSTKNREVTRRLIGRRVRNTLTGEGFSPENSVCDDLVRVFAGFLALPITTMTLPCRVYLFGELEQGSLRLEARLLPRAVDEEARKIEGDSPEARAQRRTLREAGLVTLEEWEEKAGAYGDPDHRVHAALQLMLAAHPLFTDFGRSYTNPVWLPRSLWDHFLFRTAPVLNAMGIQIHLPATLQNIERPKLVLTATDTPQPAQPRRGKRLATQGMLNAAALADFRWEIAVGEERLTIDELRKRIDAEGELISSGSSFFHMTRADLDKLVHEWMAAQSKPLSKWEKLRALLSGDLNGKRVEATDSLLEQIRKSAVVKELPSPGGLEAVLRPYQVRGFSWLVQNVLLGLGSLLADDMGLGKTVQVIAAAVELKNRGLLDEGRIIIAAPASLLVNWQREITRFAPDLTTRIHHGKERDLGTGKDRPDVLITSYGLLKRDLAKLAKEKYRLLVLDEAQAVKNAKTGQARAAAEFPADAVIALTGTPVENRLSEYWSIFSILEPGLLGTTAEFNREFVVPIEEHRDRAAIDRFRKITAPFLLRRVKTDPNILDELPEKNAVDYYTTLTPRQVALYEACLNENMESLENLEAEADSWDEKGRKRNAAQARLNRRGQILRMILHLKQICNSPSQFMKERADEPDSGKAQALMELLHRCRESGRKALIFTQFREMGERLVEWIEKEMKRRPAFLHGGVPAAKRMEMVDEFQNDPEAEVFVLSLKAGGTGLNLTAASAVIHYDLWWNPAVEDQASDRAWRIGQRRDVIVYRFITAGTFEEKVNEMLKKKRELADLAVGVGESWIGDLTDDEIRSIFTLQK